jgi:DNA-binding GntR family transcriptional regulator
MPTAKMKSRTSARAQPAGGARAEPARHAPAGRAAARGDAPLAELTNRIALDIQAGVLAPGTWLKQIDLEARYGCTRMELRRALDRLVAKRLVEHVHNRGYHVFVADSRVYAELHDIRTVLELRAAELICEHATAADVRELRRLAKRFDALLPGGTVFEQYDANVAFHVRWLDICPNRELAELIMEIRRRGPSAPIFQWKSHARMEQSSREHVAMVDALEDRQLARLQKLVREHIQQTESSDHGAVQSLPRRVG